MIHPTALPSSARVLALILVVASASLSLQAQDNAPKNPPANPALRNGAAPSLDGLMNLLDKDHDGRVSKSEATGNYAQRFSQWDADGDGYATRQEIHDYRAKLGITDEGRPAGGNRGPNPNANAGTKEAALLKEPADWRMETMPVPPGFAPGIKLKGSEEIRFSPGMFNNTAPDYFTCVIGITAEGDSAIGTADLKDFLENYYRGLSGGRASRSGTKSGSIEEMVATVHPAKESAESAGRFDADMVFFDSFSDGRKITLHIEAEAIARPSLKKNFLILLVSPAAKDSDVWKHLRGIGEKVVKNVPGADAK